MKEVGTFAVHLRIPPAQYYALTVEERAAIVDAWNEAQKRS